MVSVEENALASLMCFLEAIIITVSLPYQIVVWCAGDVTLVYFGNLQGNSGLFGFPE